MSGPQGQGSSVHCIGKEEMSNSLRGRMAGYLRTGSLVQLVFMIVVGLILYNALTEHWDTLRRVSLFLKNGFFGTPEPQTSVVLYLICILVLSWLAIIKCALSRLSSASSGVTKTVAAVTVLGMSFISTTVVLFCGLYVLIWSSPAGAMMKMAGIADEHLGGVYTYAVILCGVTLLAVIVDFVLLVIYWVRVGRSSEG